MSDQVTFTDYEVERAVKKVQDLGGKWRDGTAELCLKLKITEEKVKELEDRLSFYEAPRRRSKV